jgi:hypothetical protein
LKIASRPSVHAHGPSEFHPGPLYNRPFQYCSTKSISNIMLYSTTQQSPQADHVWLSLLRMRSSRYQVLDGKVCHPAWRIPQRLPRKVERVWIQQIRQQKRWVVKTRSRVAPIHGDGRFRQRSSGVLGRQRGDLRHWLRAPFETIIRNLPQSAPVQSTDTQKSNTHIPIIVLSRVLNVHNHAFEPSDTRVSYIQVLRLDCT